MLQFVDSACGGTGFCSYSLPPLGEIDHLDAQPFLSLGAGGDVCRQRREVTNWTIGHKPPKESAKSGKERDLEGREVKMQLSGKGSTGNGGEQGLRGNRAPTHQHLAANSGPRWAKVELMVPYLGEFKILG